MYRKHPKNMPNSIPQMEKMGFSRGKVRPLSGTSPTNSKGLSA